MAGRGPAAGRIFRGRVDGDAARSLAGGVDGGSRPRRGAPRGYSEDGSRRPAAGVPRGYSEGAAVPRQRRPPAGKNAMPAFGGRLSDEEIGDVAAYVIDQANGDKWDE